MSLTAKATTYRGVRIMESAPDKFMWNYDNKLNQSSSLDQAHTQIDSKMGTTVRAPKPEPEVRVESPPSPSNLGPSPPAPSEMVSAPIAPFVPVDEPTKTTFQGVMITRLSSGLYSFVLGGETYTRGDLGSAERAVGNVQAVAEQARRLEPFVPKLDEVQKKAAQSNVEATAALIRTQEYIREIDSAIGDYKQAIVDAQTALDDATANMNDIRDTRLQYTPESYTEYKVNYNQYKADVEDAIKKYSGQVQFLEFGKVAEGERVEELETWRTEYQQWTRDYGTQKYESWRVNEAFDSLKDAGVLSEKDDVTSVTAEYYDLTPSQLVAVTILGVDVDQWKSDTDTQLVQIEEINNTLDSLSSTGVIKQDGDSYSLIKPVWELTDKEFAQAEEVGFDIEPFEVPESADVFGTGTEIPFSGETKVVDGKEQYLFSTPDGGGRWLTKEQIYTGNIALSPTRTRVSLETKQLRALINERDKYRKGSAEWDAWNKKVNEYEYIPFEPVQLAAVGVSPATTISPATIVSPTSVEDLILQAHISGLDKAKSEVLGQLQTSSITITEANELLAGLEGAHGAWYSGFVESGATDKEVEEFTDARANESAKQLEATISTLLSMEVAGDISHEQMLDLVESYSAQQLEDVSKIISGKDLLIGQSGLSIDFDYGDTKTKYLVEYDVGHETTSKTFATELEAQAFIDSLPQRKEFKVRASWTDESGKNRSRLFYTNEEAEAFTDSLKLTETPSQVWTVKTVDSSGVSTDTTFDSAERAHRYMESQYVGLTQAEMDQQSAFYKLQNQGVINTVTNDAGEAEYTPNTPSNRFKNRR